MIYKRHCILDLAQCARASTCPDTLLDACERPRANLDSTIALACSSLPATMHTFIVPSSSARSCRYAICAQRCACERERPLLASSLSCAHAAEQARHRKQALGQRRPPLRPPRSRSKARDDAAPAQRPRGRTLDCTARTPRQLHIRPAATTDPPTTAARKANSLHAVQTVRLAGTSDVAASSSSTLQIWPTPATTSAAPSLDPGSAATQLPENGLQGSFYFTCGVRPS